MTVPLALNPFEPINCIYAKTLWSVVLNLCIF